MSETTRRIRIICAILCAACIALSGALSTAISAEAGRAQLSYTDQATDGDPPEVALGIAMGAFRGIFVQYLWLRANRLKEAGKYYEAIELSSAITKLQPRFPRVWAFHAWNMAYNISVATQTAAERWTWVKAGVDLLRLQGIPKNPNDVQLHKELAWIFVHKIQGFSDDANRYYKRQMAHDWTMVLGSPPKLPEDRDAAVEVMAEWLAVVVDAPETLEGLLEAEARTLRTQANLPPLPPGETAREAPDTPPSLIAQLIEQIEANGITPGIDLLKLVSIQSRVRDAEYMQTPEELRNTPNVGAYFRTLLTQNNLLNQRITALYNDPTYTPAWDALIPHLRKRALIDDYGMEPDRMLRYTRAVGPLDWRHPASHALYWSYRGVEQGILRQRATRFTTLNTDRVTITAIQELFRSGTVIYDPITGSYFTTIDLHWTDSYLDFMRQAVERAGDDQDPTKRVYTTWSAGYENHLKDVIRVYFRRGRFADAQKYFNMFRANPYMTRNTGTTEYLAGLSLEQFVYEQLKEERLSIPHVAAGEVTGALEDALVRGLLIGDYDTFDAAFDFARRAHKAYFDLQNVRTNADIVNRMEEMNPDFNLVVRDVFYRLLTSSGLDFTDASSIYKKVSTDLQRFVYDELARYYSTMNSTPLPKPVLDNLFPEPPGMPAYRRAREQERRESLDFEQQ